MAITEYTGGVPNRSTQTQAAFSTNVDTFLTWLNGAVPEFNALAVGSTESGTFNALSLGSNGTASAPVFSFASSPTTGLYRISADNIGLSVAGALRYTFGASTFAYAGTTMTIGGGQVYRAGVDLGVVGAIIEDQKASGTAGGAFTSGADRTRDLNTYVYNGLGLGAISGNQFVLPAGTYEVAFEALAYEVNGHQSLLYNVTDAAVVGRGMNSRAIPATSPTISAGVARFTIAGIRTFELRHRCALTGSFGQALGFGSIPEVYARVVIRKLA